MALAVHEAAHFTVCRAMGFDAEGCSIDARGGGVMRYTHRVGDTASPDGRRRLVAVALGGMLGERMHFGREHAGRCAIDHRKATALLMREPRDRRVRVQREAINLARDALRARWPFTLALACELREVGRWGL